MEQEVMRRGYSWIFLSAVWIDQILEKKGEGKRKKRKRYILRVIER
jgi:hypothetical protein